VVYPPQGDDNADEVAPVGEGFTHIDEEGSPAMVDVGNKPDTLREARARGLVRMSPETLKLIREGKNPKGAVFQVAKIAAIMACKHTWSLIPLCHPIQITGVEVDFKADWERGEVEVEVGVNSFGKTGVEMEALTGVAVAALTVYDMCKALDKTIVVDNIRLIKKSGGKSGEFIREGEEPWEERRP